jgi:undecaprenyl-diphosphatase
LNERVLDLVNGHAGNAPVLDDVARFEAIYGIAVLAGLIAAFVLAEMRRDYRHGLAVLGAGAIALGLALIAAQFAGHLVTEARPFVHDRDTNQLIAHAADNSFPSDHATMAAAGAVLAAFAWRRWAAAFLLLAFAVGLGRVYVGVHFPGDVLTGFAIGGGAALTAWFVCAEELRAWTTSGKTPSPS